MIEDIHFHIETSHSYKFYHHSYIEWSIDNHVNLLYFINNFVYVNKNSRFSNDDTIKFYTI